jgi:formyl-CoA transferase
MVAMLDFQATRWLIDKEVPPQAGNNHPTGIPTGTFKTQDGYINIAASGQHMWKRLCAALEIMDLFEDPRFSTPGRRSKNRDVLNALLEEKLQTKAAAEWVEILNGVGVPCGPILTIDKVFENEQVQHLALAQPLAHPQLGTIQVLGFPVTLSRTPGALRLPTPEKGAHTQEILRELALSAEEIRQLQEAGVVQDETAS